MFVKKSKINISKYKSSITCYNANDIQNKARTITNFVKIKLNIRNYVRNRPATKPVMLKVHNVKLSFNIWLVLYMYFILYS